VTPRQTAALEFVRQSIAGGRCPSVREIGQHLGVSRGGAALHLQALEMQGVIRREYRRARAIELLDDRRGIPVIGLVDAEGRIPAETLDRIQGAEAEELWDERFTVNRGALCS
jgi:SOS-response transcriptional repressor LexA